MRPTVKRSEDGYSIYGLEPPGLAESHGIFRKMFWRWVVEFGLKEKDRDLSKGLGADGKGLRPISPQTKRTRKSKMTPSGKGDPEAPPLIPGWQKSRTRSLLTGKAFEDHAEFWWKYDAYTGDSWARILEYQVDMGRDVFGLGPKALERTRRQAVARWDAYKKGLYEDRAPKPVVRPKEVQPKTVEGHPDIRGLTIKEWETHFRQTAKAYLPGRPTRPKTMSPISGPRYNRLLGHSFGVPAKVVKATPILVRRPVAKPIDFSFIWNWIYGK